LAKTTTKDIRQFAACAGFIGPILFIAVFTIEGFLRTGYNSISTYISDLSIGPRGIIQISNFIVFGSLFLFFAYGLILEFRLSGMSLTGPRLLALMAVLLILSGPFVTDPIGTPILEMTWHGIIHNIIGAIFFLLGPISCYVFWRTFRERLQWSSFRRFTLYITVTLSIFLVIFSVAQKGAALTPNILTEYAGAIQRINIITFLFWIVVFAWVYYIHLNQSKSVHA
jgi:hypothetical protein